MIFQERHQMRVFNEDPRLIDHLPHSKPGYTREATALATFTDQQGQLRLITSDLSEGIDIWDPDTGERVGPSFRGKPPFASETTLTAQDWDSLLLSFTTPDGDPRLVTCSVADQLQVWDPTTGRQTCPPLVGHTDMICDLALWHTDTGEPRLVSADWDGTVRVWDPIRGQQLGEPLCEGSVGPTVGAWSTGFWAALAVARLGGEVQRFDAQSRTPIPGSLSLPEVEAISTSPRPLAWCRDGHEAALSAWDLETEELVYLFGPTAVLELCFARPLRTAAGELRYVLGDPCGPIEIWDPERDECTYRFQPWQHLTVRMLEDGHIVTRNRYAGFHDLICLPNQRLALGLHNGWATVQLPADI